MMDTKTIRTGMFEFFIASLLVNDVILMWRQHFSFVDNQIWASILIIIDLPLLKYN
jgi:hypothetical protein